MLAGSLTLALEVGAAGWQLANAVLDALARAGVVPEGSHAANIPAVLALLSRPEAHQ